MSLFFIVSQGDVDAFDLSHILNSATNGETT